MNALPLPTFSGTSTTIGTDDLEKQDQPQQDQPEQICRPLWLRSAVGDLTTRITKGAHFVSKSLRRQSGQGAAAAQDVIITVRPLNRFTYGYPNLAAFNDSEDAYMIYRRFGYLQSRVLLDKQDQLRLLEEELDAFDAHHNGCSVTRVPNSRIATKLEKRRELLDKIDTQVQSYAAALSSAQQLMGFNKPSDSEHTSVSNYLYQHKPVQAEELTYIQHKEDLITLRPGREHAWLDRAIETTLRLIQPALPFTHRLFSSPETRAKNGDPKFFKNVYYYTRTRIQNSALAILIIALLALLIVPVWLLYHLVLCGQGTLSSRSNAICIGIMLISTMLFTAVLSLFTQGKRHELLAAAAAYCALLVFFFGTVNVA